MGTLRRLCTNSRYGRRDPEFRRFKPPNRRLGIPCETRLATFAHYDRRRSYEFLVGFVYLLVRKVITWHTPVVFIGAVFALAFAITGDVTTALYYTLSGGTFIGAIFMATDYVTSPSTAKGKIVFALGCAVITTLIRFYGSYPEGVSFSILFMNILNPYIDKWTMKKPFGGVKA